MIEIPKKGTVNPSLKIQQSSVKPFFVFLFPLNCYSFFLSHTQTHTQDLFLPFFRPVSPPTSNQKFLWVFSKFVSYPFISPHLHTLAFLFSFCTSLIWQILHFNNCTQRRGV